MAMAYGQVGVGADTANSAREPIASMADNLGRETGLLIDRLTKINDRISGSQPRPAEMLANAKVESSPPIHLSMSRLNQNIQRCQNILNEIEGALG